MKTKTIRVFSKSWVAGGGVHVPADAQIISVIPENGTRYAGVLYGITKDIDRPNLLHLRLKRRRNRRK